MSKASKLLAVGLLLTLTSCSRSVDVEDRGDGVCVQVSKTSFIGIGTSHENLIKCPEKDNS